MESNNNSSTRIFNLFVKHLDGKTLTLKFNSPILSPISIKHRLFHITGIPPLHQRLVTGTRNLSDTDTIVSDGDSSSSTNMFPTVRLLLRLKGGKGGFGSLLRGAATKAGQKKTNNFDACRDMSGRRLRHVNAEKRLEEWKAGEEERKLEKVAEEFLKKQMRKGKKGLGEGEASKYVAKYREESERCVAEVALSVKEALMMNGNGKRKGEEGGKGDDANKKKLKICCLFDELTRRDRISDSYAGDKGGAKKLKIWMGKRKLNENDSDYSSEDDEENEKSILLNSQNESDSNKNEGSLGSVTGQKHDGGSSGAGSCESGSEEEKDTVVEAKVESVGSHGDVAIDPVSVASEFSAEDSGAQVCNGVVFEKFDVAVSRASTIASSENVADASKYNMEIDESLQHKALVDGETSASIPTLEEPLNFDTFNSAAELEVLGLERLKSELQSRGLKCGGTLQERAARLFLLKSTPLDKLPKKLLAKK
ncbi:hypothetical protein RIF29_24090 [Crotalaria pallida]|uniref:Sde2 N-terminal ubiquitin domain-containing protein n=1 Tax=Crotalaria pallida TaxID=3830 RepID=A0AAN9ELJ6_CROPI